MVRRGYTLLEACVVMLIVSIFMAIMANVVPHKAKPKVEKDAHGRFECYYNGSGQLVQQTINAGSAGTLASVAQCTFTPPAYVRYMVINAVGGGAGNGSGTGTAGRFVSTFYTANNNSYTIIPGTAGTGSNNGNPTYINETSTGNNLITVDGGVNLGPTGKFNTSISDVKRCTVTAGPQIRNDNAFSRGYACSRGPICEIEGEWVKVSYCRTTELYKTAYLPWKNDGSAAYSDYMASQFIVNNTVNSVWNSSTGVMTYYDTSLFTDYGSDPYTGWTVNDTYTPSLYTISLQLNIASQQTTSLMTQYLKMMQITTGMGSVNPGDTAKAGGVLILW